MKIQWNARSIIGLVFVILAAVGLVINLAGVIQVWVLREPVTRDAIATLDLLNSTLDTTAQGLGVAKSSLESVTGTIGVLAEYGQFCGHDDQRVPARLLSSVSSIIGENLSATINSALGTLDAVESTTRKR